MKSDTPYQPNTAIERWLDSRLPIPRLMYENFTTFPTPRNLTYLWTFGGILTFILMVQIITGVVAAMHYVPDVSMAFDSIERLMRDVNYGWLMRYTHAVGASMFFLAVYIHIFRGLYYGSYKAPREILWILGVIILLLMMATAFMGYSLPWGQMSFWAVTVITNLFSSLDSVIPGLGTTLVEWIWGGFAVGEPTLVRLFSLHYLFPFLIAACVGLHIWALHVTGNNNPTGVEVQNVKKETVPFHPYISVKDGFALAVFAIIFAYFVFYMPNYLGHAENYIPADPLVTPPHIVPEWYFLPFYAILRAIPDKLGGVIAMFAAIAVLFFIPWLDTSRVRSASYRPLYRPFFWLFVFTCIALGYLGAKPAEGGYVTAARFFTAYYFIHFLVVMPVVGLIERPKQRPGSLSEAIYGSHEGKGASPDAVPAAPEKR